MKWQQFKDLGSIEVEGDAYYATIGPSGTKYLSPVRRVGGSSEARFNCEIGQMGLAEAEEFKRQGNIFPEVAPQSPTGVDATLAERGKRYGVFTGHAKITQFLKRYFRSLPKWDILANDQQEALDMIAHKIGRIFNGDPNYRDSWHDIAGYAKLVDDRLLEDEGKQNGQ